MRAYTIGLLAGVLLATGNACQDRRSAQPPAAIAQEWQRVPLRHCTGEQLGKDAGSLRSAMTDAVGPLQVRERNKIWRHGEIPKYDLTSVAYFAGDVEAKPLLVACGSFLEKGVLRFYQTNALVTIVSFDGKQAVVSVDEDMTGLVSPDGVMVWRFGKTRHARLLLKKCVNPHQYTIGTAVAVWDYDLSTGACTGYLGLGTSEHDFRRPLHLVIDMTSGQMVITATHPEAGQDPEAELCAGSDDPRVRIEQLRRTCVRVTLPNPS